MQMIPIRIPHPLQVKKQIQLQRQPIPCSIEALIASLIMMIRTSKLTVMRMVEQRCLFVIDAKLPDRLMI